MFERKVLEVEGLAGAHANPCKFRADGLVPCRLRDELQGGVEIVEEVVLDARQWWPAGSRSWARQAGRVA